MARVRLLLPPVVALLLLGISCVPYTLPTSTSPAPAPTAMPPASSTPAATPSPSGPGPVITSIQYFDTVQNAATIVWSTNVPTIGRVEYGKTSDYGSTSAWSLTFSTNNGVTLSGLDMFATYFVRVRVRDAAGNETVSKGSPIFIYWDQADQPWRTLEP